MSVILYNCQIIRKEKSDQNKLYIAGFLGQQPIGDPMFRVPAPNFTQTPNILFDEWLPQLKLVELRVLMVILRKTFGWQKIKDRISLRQLEKLTGSQRRDIIKAVDRLEELGLIKKDVSGQNGYQETFYELIVHEDSNNSYRCESHTPPSVNLTPTKETNTKETISPVVLKEDSISFSKRSRIHGTNPRALGTNPRSLGTNPRKTKREDKEEKCPRVWIAPSQEQDLLRRLNGDQKKLTACYEKLSGWKFEKMIDGGKNDYGAIIKWVIEAVERDVSQGKTSAIQQIESDKELIDKVRNKFPNENRIHHGYNYIAFDFGPQNYIIIKIGENGFRENLINQLRKMNITTEDL